MQFSTPPRLRRAWPPRCAAEARLSARGCARPTPAAAPPAPHARLLGVQAVAPGAWGARAAAAAPPPDAAPPASPHAVDEADAPRDADDFELLALLAATPPHAPGAPSVSERCSALRALRAGATLMPEAPTAAGLSATCCSAALDAVVLAWAAAAESDAAAAERPLGAPGDAAAAEALRQWLDAAEQALQALSRWAAFAPKALPQRFAGALFGRLALPRAREDEATRLRAVLHWCAPPEAQRRDY